MKKTNVIENFDFNTFCSMSKASQRKLLKSFSPELKNEFLSEAEEMVHKSMERKYEMKFHTVKPSKSDPNRTCELVKVEIPNANFGGINKYSNIYTLIYESSLQAA